MSAAAEPSEAPTCRVSSRSRRASPESLHSREAQCAQRGGDADADQDDARARVRLSGAAGPPQDQIRTTRDDDQLGPDPVAAWQASAAGLLAAFDRALALAQRFMGLPPGA